jgi:hypothetical protein
VVRARYVFRPAKSKSELQCPRDAVSDSLLALLQTLSSSRWDCLGKRE